MLVITFQKPALRQNLVQEIHVQLGQNGPIMVHAQPRAAEEKNRERENVSILTIILFQLEMKITAKDDLMT